MSFILNTNFTCKNPKTQVRDYIHVWRLTHHIWHNLLTTASLHRSNESAYIAHFYQAVASTCSSRTHRPVTCQRMWLSPRQVPANTWNYTSRLRKMHCSQVWDSLSCIWSLISIPYASLCSEWIKLRTAAPPTNSLTERNSNLLFILKGTHV